MDSKEPKIKEAPLSLRSGLVEAQQVTSTNKNKTKPKKKKPRRVAAGKKKNLLNTTGEWEKKRWKEVQRNSKIQRILAPQVQAMELEPLLSLSCHRMPLWDPPLQGLLQVMSRGWFFLFAKIKFLIISLWKHWPTQLPCLDRLLELDWLQRKSSRNRWLLIRVQIS